MFLLLAAKHKPNEVCACLFVYLKHLRCQSSLMFRYILLTKAEEPRYPIAPHMMPSPKQNIAVYLRHNTGWSVVERCAPYVAI